VGRLAVAVDGPMDFLNKADDIDKKNVKTPLIIGVVFLLAVAGIVFTIFEHTKPMSTFGKEAIRLAKGETDVLAPSKFRGAYKKIASDINDGIDKIAAKGGAPRRAADLEQVLGPIPAAPTMSAFQVPGGGEMSSAVMPAPVAGGASKTLPKALPKPKPRGSNPDATNEASEAVAGGATDGTPSARKPPPPLPKSGADGAEGDEESEWKAVFDQFIALKEQCGEPTAGMTFDKFKTTLLRNKDALVQRGATAVKFTVYVKEGKAALKATPANK
jgi:hypothetical protein